MTKFTTDVVRDDLIESYFCAIRVKGRKAKIVKHLRKVIKFYSNEQQWEEFKEMEKE